MPPPLRPPPLPRPDLTPSSSPSHHHDLTQANEKDEKHERYLRRKLEHLSWEAQRRADICLPQALSALCSVFAARLSQELDAARSCEVVGDRGRSRLSQELDAARAATEAAPHATRHGTAIAGAAGTADGGDGGRDDGNGGVGGGDSGVGGSDSGGGGGRGTFTMRMWSEIGFLVGWESLLSTYGKEERMLGDLYGAVQVRAC